MGNTKLIEGLKGKVDEVQSGPDREFLEGPGWVVQLVRVSFPYAKVVGSIPGQGTYKTHPMRA